MAKKPVVFVGSSTEGLSISEAIQFNLRKDFDVVLWNQGSFEISKTYIESLVELRKVDFAILVLTDDDVLKSRKKVKDAPRDNVIFELGLFIGFLGRERTFFVYDETRPLKIPTDLLGVAAPTYRIQESGSLESSLGPACTLIKRQIQKVGLRVKLDAAAIAAQQGIQDLAKRAAGRWWSFRHWDPARTIGVVTLTYDPVAGGLDIDGTGYDLEGNLVAKWDSTASCVYFPDRRVYYYWEGWKPSKPGGQPGADFKGFGEFSFPASNGAFRTAVGQFSERTLTGVTNTKIKSSEYRRCTQREADVIDRGDPARIGKLVHRKLKPQSKRPGTRKRGTRRKSSNKA